MSENSESQDVGADSRVEEDLRTRLAEVEAALEQNTALLHVQEMEEMDRAREWYLRNAADLRLAMNSLNESGLGLQLFLRGGEVAWDDEDGTREFFVNVGLRWHNYVASAVTVADHMKHLFRAQHDDLKSEYEGKIAELIAPHGVVAFVHRSRNVTLHRGVFNMGATWKFQPRDRQRFEVYCRTDMLLNRYKSWWTPSARDYLRSQAPNINLASVVDEYGKVVDVLYDWYEDRFYEYHYPTLAAFEAMAVEYREISEELEPGGLPQHNPTATFSTPEARHTQAEAARIAVARPVPPARRPKLTAKKRSNRKKR